MKKLFLYAINAVLLITLIIFACTTERIEINDSISTDNCIKIFEKIGETHNECLDLIYFEIESFLQEKPANNVTIKDILKLSEHTNKSFLKNFDLCVETTSYTYSHIESVFSDIELPERKSLMDFSLQKMDFQFSEVLIKFFEDLHAVLLLENRNVEQLIFAIEQIEAQSLNVLSADDQDVFLSSTSVAKHTLAYWDSKYMDWKMLLSMNEKTITKKEDFCWKSLAIEDVAGAVGGAAGAKVAAFFGPIGWKAMAGIIGGAATANSVKYAVATIMSEGSNEQEEQ